MTTQSPTLVLRASHSELVGRRFRRATVRAMRRILCTVRVVADVLSGKTRIALITTTLT